MIQQVNLYPAELRPRREPLQFRQLLWGMATVVLAVIVTWLVLCWRQHGLQQHADALQARLDAEQQVLTQKTEAVAAMHEDPALQAAITDLQSQVRQRQQLLQQIQRLQQTAEAGFSRYLQALAAQSSNRLWLTGIVLHGDTGEMRLQGQATQADAVPLYLERLRQEPAFKGAVFGDFQMHKQEDRPLLQFELSSQADGDNKRRTAP